MTRTDADTGGAVRALVTSVATLAGDLGYDDTRAEMQALCDRLDDRELATVLEAAALLQRVTER